MHLCKTVIFSGYSEFLHQQDWPPSYTGVTELSLKVALNTITLTLYTSKWKILCFIIWCWFHTQFIYFAQFSMFLYVIEMFTTLLGQSHYRHWHCYHCILQFLKNVVIIIKAKADLSWSWLFCVCRLVFLLLKLLNYLAFQSLDLERTWWRLIQKLSVCTKLDIYVLLLLLLFLLIMIL